MIKNIEDTIQETIGGADLDETESKYAINVMGDVFVLIFRQIDPEFEEAYKDNGGEMSITQTLTYLMESDWEAYFSDETLELFGELVYHLGIKQDYAAVKDVFEDWSTERERHFLANMRPTEWGYFLINAFMYYTFMKEGTGNILGEVDMVVFGVPWLIFGFIMIGAQILFLLFVNDWYAQGNVFLVGMQVYTLVQFVSSYFLMFNIKQFDYMFYLRIWRYVSLASAVLFNIVYLSFLFSDLALINRNQEFDIDDQTYEIIILKAEGLSDEQDWAVYDLLAALFMSYVLVIYIPTFIVNTAIFSKEMFMNQFAWTQDEDYTKGALLEKIDPSFFEMFGISNDEDYYLGQIKEFTHEYI